MPTSAQEARVSSSGDGEWMRAWEDDCRAAGLTLACDSVICCDAPDEEGLVAVAAVVQQNGKTQTVPRFHGGSLRNIERVAGVEDLEHYLSTLVRPQMSRA